MVEVEEDRPADGPGAWATTLRPTERVAAASEPAAELARGDLVGRYVVLSRVGRGGMGVVYAAYDPELDRKVAVKLLADGGDDGQARLMREAQAMARLAHPNVVAVYDVGTLKERVWLAMEFVRGDTLGQWRRAATRSWREVLLMYLRAGEGLQAAHAAGLVHRDFKPDNVMVGVDGRVRVMDFGLARRDSSVLAAVSSRSGQRRVPAGPAGATSDHVVAGTPQYMAAEQWQGAATDARTDQFSFCVALWEAVHGSPPFVGLGLEGLVDAVLAGRISGSTRKEVPGWLQRALVRGLAVDPRRRWPSMTALLAALGRGHAGPRRQRWLVGVMAALLGVAAVTVGVRHERSQRRAHAELQAQVRVTRAHASALVGQVLAARLGLLADYDPVVLELRRFVAAEAGLQARAEAAGGPELPAISRQLARCHEAAGRTRELVERFKTQHAVVRNSSQRFPVLVAELAGASPELDPRLLALLRELLRFGDVARAEQVAEIRAALATLALTPTSALLSAQINLLRRHAELILVARPAVDQIVAELLDLQAEGRYEPLAALIVDNDAATIGVDDEVGRWGLLVLGVVVAGAALFVWRRRRAR